MKCEYFFEEVSSNKKIRIKKSLFKGYIATKKKFKLKSIFYTLYNNLISFCISTLTLFIPPTFRNYMEFFQSFSLTNITVKSNPPSSWIKGTVSHSGDWISATCIQWKNLVLARIVEFHCLFIHERRNRWCREVFLFLC